MVPSLVSDSFAGTDNQGRDKGKKISNGCDKGKQDKNNPNCGPPECPEGQHYDEFGNCVLDDPPTPDGFTICDTNGDGAIEFTEFKAKGIDSVDQDTIDAIETIAGSPSPNGVIDTEAELSVLNDNFNTICVL